jgi:competence protein ComEA
MKAQKMIASVVGVLAVLVAAAAAQADVGKETSGTTQAASGVVNVNTATAEQLALLPGIGPSRAAAIIEAREHRPFASVNDLVRVRGIGRAMLQRLTPYVTTQGETTLRRSVPMRQAEH